MENGGSSSTGINENATVQTFNPSALQQTFFQSVYNNDTTTNNFAGSCLDNTVHGGGSYTQQQQQFAGVMPEPLATIGRGPASLHPAQKPILHANQLNCQSPATPVSAPLTTQHQNQIYTSGRAGSLPIEPQQSLDQYLTAPQSHLLQLHGTNPSGQPSQSDNFYRYGTSNVPQHFPSFHTYMFSTDQSMKQSNVREILDEESSPSFRESSHINRKKRKACGRCGPCRRKDNCGTCMNCINRAKGKQICIFRKCEELKKKPGTESYVPATPDHQLDSATVGQEKRKELEQLFVESKRSRTEDTTITLHQGAQVRSKFPVLAAGNQRFPQPHGSVQSTSGPRQYYNTLPIQGSGGTFQHQIQSSNSTLTNNLLADAKTINQPSETPGNSHTTDIISEALREIDYSTLESNDLKAVLHQTIPSNIPQQQTNYQQQWSQNVPPVNSVLNTEGQTVLLPGQPPPLPPGPGPGEAPRPHEASTQQFSSISQPITSSQTLPDQLLRNLTRFNEFGSFQGSNSSPIQGSIHNKRPPSVSRANYVDTSDDINPLLYTPAVTKYSSEVGNSATTISLSTRPTLYNQPSSVSTPSSMYHNVCSLTFGNEETTQNTSFQHSNPHASVAPQLHQQYGSHFLNSNMQRLPTHLTEMQNGSLVGSQGIGFSNPPLYGSQIGEVQTQQFNPSLSQVSPEYRSNMSSARPHAFPDQSTSNSAIVGQTPMPTHPAPRAGFYNPHANNPQWAGVEYRNQQAPSALLQMSSNSAISNADQKSSHSSLHSPVSYHKEVGDHRPVVGQMPELMPSPVSQPSDSDLTKPDDSKQISPTVSAELALNVPGKFFNGAGRQSNNSHSTRGSLSHAEALSSSVNAARGTQPSDHIQESCIPSVSGCTNQSLLFSQSGQSLGQPVSLPSQSDANSTISPGESGYDSADIVHNSEDASSHQVPYYNTVSENNEHDIPQSKDPKEPKNLYRAPVGAKAGLHNSLYMCKFPAPQIKLDLPSAGALKLARTSDVRKNSIGTKTPPRRSSCDSGIDLLVGNVRPIKIRRYSMPENESKDWMGKFPVSEGSSDTKSAHGKISKCSSLESSGDSFTAESLLTSPKPDAIWTHKGRRMAPFDTPPLTPRSGDFAYRHSSIDAVNENIKVGDVLPTPPHQGETPFRKSSLVDYMQDNVEPRTNVDGISHRGYKPQTDNSSPRKTEFAPCTCIEGTDGRTDEAPYYTHLGAADSIAGIRRLFEKRTGYSGNALRIEKVIYTGKEGKTSRGCPMAKWIIRRSGEHEKVLVVCRQRPGHHCATAVIVVIILLWDGVARPLADFAYSNFTNVVPKHGEPTERRCATNDDRTCACQGFDDSTCGASFSFGCSWSMYYNGCKYARSNNPNKYKLTGTKDTDAERFIGVLCEKLATVMSPLYEMAAPDAFHNQVEFEEDGFECRLGEGDKKNSRPFSGVTSCLDFCAHAHKDQHNMDNGSTVVVTFTKPELRTIGGKHSDEQLHVLPLCKLDLTNEEGTMDGMAEKVQNGSLEILKRYHHEVRLRSKPKLSKKQKSRAKKKTDSSDSPLNKKRGRPPKRSSSVENLLEDCDAKMSRNVNADVHQRDFSYNQFQTPPRMQLFASCPPGAHGFSPQRQPAFTGPLSPTRWPYRRPVPPHGAGGIFPEAQMHPQPTKGYHDSHQNQPHNDSQSLLDNLPSIGNFFRPGAGGHSQHDSGSTNTGYPQGGTMPQTSSLQGPNLKSPSFDLPNVSVKTEESCNPLSSSLLPNSAASGQTSCTSMSPSQKTPLPSIKDVVMHPFHQNFASVLSNSSEAKAHQDAVQTPSRNDAGKEIGSSTPTRSHAAQNVLPKPYFPESQPYLDHGSKEHLSRTGQTIIYSDSEENFRDSEIGGVAVAPGHGSVLIECAKKELHATTALHRPNRLHPSRISLVFYQHKNMNARNHGAAQYNAKEEERRKQKEEKRLEEMLKPPEGVGPGIDNPLLPHGFQPSFPQDRLPSGHFPTAVFQNQNAIGRSVQVRQELNGNLHRTQPHSMLTNHCDHVSFMPTNHVAAAASPRQANAMFNGANGQVRSFTPMGYNVASPTRHSSWPSEQAGQGNVQGFGWPRSIYPSSNRFPAAPAHHNMSHTHIQHSFASSPRLPSLSPMAQSPHSPVPSPNGVHHPSPHAGVSVRPVQTIPFQQAQSPPSYAPHIQHQVYRIPSQPYPYTHHVQPGMYRPQAPPRAGLPYSQMNTQCPTMVTNRVLSPITPME